MTKNTYVIREEHGGMVRVVVTNTWRNALIESYDDEFSFSKIKGIIVNTDTEEHRKFSIKMIEGGGVDYKLGEIRKVGLEKKTKQWFVNVFISKKLVDDLDFIHKTHFKHTLPSNSFLLLKYKDVKAKYFMFNPKTRQILFSSSPFTSEFINEYMIEKSKNNIEDFITGHIKFNNFYRHGVITFSVYNIVDLKEKEISDKIVETINMFKNNGANNKTLISFGDASNDFEMKYFLKAKILW